MYTVETNDVGAKHSERGSTRSYTQVCAMTIRAKNQEQGLIQGVPKDGPAQENSARR